MKCFFFFFFVIGGLQFGWVIQLVVGLGQSWMVGWVINLRVGHRFGLDGSMIRLGLTNLFWIRLVNSWNWHAIYIYICIYFLLKDDIILRSPVFFHYNVHEQIDDFVVKKKKKAFISYCSPSQNVLLDGRSLVRVSFYFLYFH